jgi:anti-sigma B factor antagonist
MPSPEETLSTGKGIYLRAHSRERWRFDVPSSIAIDERPEAWILSARGELDYNECSGFRVQIDHILRKMPEACVVDFSRVEYLDSSGLGLLLSLSREYGTAGGHLVLVTNETVDNILEITRLDGIFSTAQDLDSALRHLHEIDTAN